MPVKCNVPRVCEQCGEPFLAYISNVRAGRGRYCSKPCSTRASAMPDIDRFYASIVVAENGCWEWIGGRNSWGYGELRFAGKPISAHRYSFLTYHGIIPAERPFVLHTCDVRHCVNPAHLFCGTHTDNMQDMIRKGRAYWQQ